MQKLIVETSKQAFDLVVNTHMEKGYKLLVGSTYVTTLESNIHVERGDVLGDVEHFFTAGVTGGREIFISHPDIDVFKMEINKRIMSGHFFLVGSLYFAATRLDGYQDTNRALINYYACCLQRE